MTKPRRRKASSFPPSFPKLFLHVAETGESVVINNLENRKASYTSLRARLNEYRRTFHYEALASGDSNRISMAEQMYAVTIRNPEKIKDKWQMEACIKEFAYEDKLNELLPDDFTPPDEAAPEKDAGAKSISEIMGEPDADMA